MLVFFLGGNSFFQAPIHSPLLPSGVSAARPLTSMPSRFNLRSGSIPGGACGESNYGEHSWHVSFLSSFPTQRRRNKNNNNLSLSLPSYEPSMSSTIQCHPQWSFQSGQPVSSLQDLVASGIADLGRWSTPMHFWGSIKLRCTHMAFIFFQV